MTMAMPGYTMRLDWKHTNELVSALADRLIRGGHTHVYGIPRGGQVVAGLLQRRGIVSCDRVEDATALVDDIIDTGDTAKRWGEQHDRPVFTLLTKDLDTKGLGGRAWIVFPWEEQDQEAEAHDHVTRLLEVLGQDVTAPGLRDTPRRVVELYREMTSGNGHTVDDILSRTFDAESDAVVTVLGIPFYSLCEHHLMPFYGTVAIGYLPGRASGGRKGGPFTVLGLSKLARLVEAFSRRLQLQERMTWEIANALQESKDLRPRGVGVLVRGHHLCMKMRGVRSDGEMVTSALLGLFRDSKEVRAEWMILSREGK